MKTIKTFLFSAVVLSGLASCVSETLDDAAKSVGTGNMNLNVNILEPTTTRTTTEVTDFPVIVKGTDVSYEKKYDAVAEIPSTVTLSVGNYTVESHTPGVISKRMTAPYYRGIEPMEIKKGVTTNVEVICKMQNSSIKVNYSDDFKDVFTSWTVTLDDGSETALGFSHNSSADPVYWYFGEEGAEKIAVNFSGITKEGSTISQSYTLTKDDESEGYDDTDNKNFTGGDAIVLNLTPTEATTGKITGINITANVTFTETGETVNVYVSDKQEFPEGGGEDEPGGDEPGGEDDAITLTLPADVFLSMNDALAGNYDPSSGDVSISCINGIQSLSVHVNSTSEDMVSALQDVARQYEGVNLLEGCEVVGNTNLVNFLGGIGQTITVPSTGTTNYTFPVGNFFGFLGILIGEHNFILKVEDIYGSVKERTVKVTITE